MGCGYFDLGVVSESNRASSSSNTLTIFTDNEDLLVELCEVVLLLKMVVKVVEAIEEEVVFDVSIVLDVENVVLILKFAGSGNALTSS